MHIIYMNKYYPISVIKFKWLIKFLVELNNNRIYENKENFFFSNIFY